MNLHEQVKILKARFTRWRFLVRYWPSGMCAVTTYAASGRLRCLAAGYPARGNYGEVQVVRVFYGIFP